MRGSFQLNYLDSVIEDWAEFSIDLTATRLEEEKSGNKVLLYSFSNAQNPIRKISSAKTDTG